jgi:hypothetical protein
MRSRLMQRCDVIGLMLEDQERPGQLLLGVRRPTPTSSRHPDVLSTPTMRVPTHLMEATLEQLRPGKHRDPALGAIHTLQSRTSVPVGQALSLASPLAFMVESLLARKLGAGDALALGTMTGTAIPAALAYDEVFDPGTDKGDPELTRMLTVRVLIQRGGNLIPSETASYSGLHWVDAGILPSAVEENHPFRLVSSLDLNICIHGLCVRSAAVVVDN